jgi:hypothetical protein
VAQPSTWQLRRQAQIPAEPPVAKQTILNA